MHHNFQHPRLPHVMQANGLSRCVALYFNVLFSLLLSNVVMQTQISAPDEGS